LAVAVGERDLAGARDVTSVIDARLRNRVELALLRSRSQPPTVPQIKRDNTPDTSDRTGLPQFNRDGTQGGPGCHRLMIYVVR
jgi:hypothetical protein